MEGEWYILKSIEEGINSLREYETNGITKFSCSEGTKDSGKLVSLMSEETKGG